MPFRVNGHAHPESCGDCIPFGPGGGWLCTPHFHPYELRCKDGAPYPERWYQSRAANLLQACEDVRRMFNRPMTVISGYRTPEYNAKIGGAKKSQHMQGRAVDFVIDGVPPATVQKAIFENQHSLHRIRGFGEYPTFTHIDTRPTTSLQHWVGTRKES